CGGCFVTPNDNTEVIGHGMILSVSQQQTTLWDQISYSGDPASFAWVLPIKSQATVGLSADVMFAALDKVTEVTIVPPSYPYCQNSCGSMDSTSFSASGPTGTSTGSGSVTIMTQETVGPYETVQLSSTDPQALTTWLTMKGYNIPTDIAPVIAAYVTEGF